MDVFGIASNVRGNWLQSQALKQDKDLHDEEIEISTKLHNEELDFAKNWNLRAIGHANNLHSQSMHITKKIDLWDMSTDLSQHFQQLNNDLISANKESDRDMYDQRSAQFQTIIVSATVMFAALCTVIIEGNLPEGCCNEVIEYLLATFSGLSFAFLFLSIVLSIKVILLCSKFMYEKSKTHNNILYQTINETSEVLAQLQQIRMDVRTDSSTTLNQNFEDYHDNMQNIVTRRENINKAIFANDPSHLKDSNEGIQHSLKRDSFEKHWEGDCKLVARAAMINFYLGTSFLLGTIAVFIFAKFNSNYNNATAGWITVAFICASCIIGGILFLKHRVERCCCCSLQSPPPGPGSGSGCPPESSPCYTELDQNQTL
mmetsp:Transcript_7810/g.13159  ORF Transcript_7810/g.13159 Transcript_7810/m.13159 type:complete len:373 (+) Transcript_7810:172-1290(+)